MKLSLHALLQLFLTTLQGINLADLSGYISFLPAKYATIIMFVLTALQSLLGLYNHFFNTDGTSQRVAKQ